jgi:outer membrane protein OmpA-like peptidoglycan-associated protein
MRRKLIYNLLIVLSLSPILVSCGVFGEAITGFAQAYTDYVNNTGSDPIGMYNQASAWQKNSVGKSLVVADLGVGALEIATGKELGGLKGVIRGTTDAYLSNDLMVKEGNDVAALVGVGLTATGKTLDYLDYKDYVKERDEFLYGEENKKYFDPESSDYDPYHFCRYIVDDARRTIREATQEEMWACIRKQDSRNVQGKARYDMINSGLVSEWEYDSLFGNDSLKQVNADLYREYNFKLALMRTDAHFNSNNGGENSSTLVVESADVTQSSSVEGSMNSEIEKRLVDEKLTAATNKIEETVVDLYKFDGYELSQEQKTELDEVAQLLNDNKELQITIYGHTCDIGTEKANYNVGMRRAEKAKTYLIEHGVDANRIQVVSQGASEPLLPNVNKENRQKNRRISFKVS